jgi:hypothetical protein
MRYSMEQRSRILDQFHQSGQSIKAFCADKELKESTLSYWLRNQCRGTSSKFREILMPAAISPSHIIIEYPGGIKIHIPAALSEVGMLLALVR